jgi:hypothetical protein
MSDEKQPRKASSVRHTRAIQRDHTKHSITTPSAEQIQERLMEIVHPATLEQVGYFHRLGLRERTLGFVVMVAFVLEMIWRQISGVSELVRMIQTEAALWATPRKVSQQAFSQRLTTLPSELFLKVLLSVLPLLQQRWEGRKRPLPAEIAWAQERYSEVQAVDGSTLDTLIRKIGLLKDLPQNPLAGKITGLLNLCSRLPSRIWYESDPKVHDQRFWPQILAVLKANSLLIFDMGYINFMIFAQLTLAGVKFITRAKSNLVYTFERAILQTANVRDSLVWIGPDDNRQLVRLVEVLYGNKWYRYLSNELDVEKLPTAYLVALYWQRWRIEIVFPQMTKTDMFAGRAGWDYISDLNIFVLDDDSVNQQFYQLSLLLKVGVFQSVLDTATEILDRSGQARKFVAPIHLMNQLLFQILHALKFMIQVYSSMLVLRQRDNLIQISFCEPIDLGLQGNLSTAQIFTSRLQFLRQPATALCSLQGSSNDFRVRQELTHILPNQFIQLVGRDVAGSTTFVEMRINHIHFPLADIIIITGMQGAAVATEMANATAYQGSQQILMGGIVAAGELLVVGHLDLDPLKLLGVNNGRNDRNREPFCFWVFDAALSWLTNRVRGRTTQMRFDPMCTACIHSTSVNWIGQNTSHRSGIPIFSPMGCRNPHSVQVVNQTIQGCVFLQVKCEHFPYYCCFGFIDCHLGRIPRTIRIRLVPVGWLCPGQQDPSPVFGLTTTSHPIGNQGPFIFCNGSPNLQEQLVVWILADRTIQKFNPATNFLPLFQQQHLVNIVPCQTIWRSDHNAVYFPCNHPVPQAVQAWPVQVCTADPIIPKNVFWLQYPALLFNIGHQAFQLLLNGLCLCLMLGRYSRIDRYLHAAPPVLAASGFPRRSEQFPISTGTLDPIGSAHPDTPAFPVGFSTGVSWLPPHSELSGVEYTLSVTGARDRSERRQ